MKFLLSLLLLNLSLFAVNLSLTGNQEYSNKSTNNTISINHSFNSNNENIIIENKNVKFNYLNDYKKIKPTISFKNIDNAKSIIVEQLLKFDIEQLNYFTIIEDNENSDFVFEYRIRENLKNNKYYFEFNVIENGNNVIYSRIDDDKKNIYFLLHKSIYLFGINLGYEKKEIEWMTKKILLVNNYIKQKQQIILTDYTLQHKEVLLSNGMFSFPKWSNDNQTSFFYTSLKEELPTLFEYNLNDKKTTKILENEGLLICSDVSKTNNKFLLLTLNKNGQSDIFLYNLQTKLKTQLTFYKGSDVNPKFVSESKIAFVSDRKVKPFIYLKQIGQKSIIEQITSEYPTSSFDSVNENIVFKMKKSNEKYAINDYDLYFRNINKEKNIKLTNGGHNSLETMSSNGKIILFKKFDNLKSNIVLLNTDNGVSQFINHKFENILSMEW